MLDTLAPCLGHRWLARLLDHELSWLPRPYNVRSHGGRVIAARRLCVDCGRANRISAARMKFCTSLGSSIADECLFNQIGHDLRFSSGMCGDVRILTLVCMGTLQINDMPLDHMAYKSVL